MGLDWWADEYEKTGSWGALIDSFSNTTESQTLYSATSTPDLVEQVFQQSLGRGTATEAGREYWADQLDSGAVTRGDLILTVLQAAAASSGPDGGTIANKLSAANYFTEMLAADSALAASFSGAVAAADARTILTRVDSTPASVTTSRGRTILRLTIGAVLVRKIVRLTMGRLVLHRQLVLIIVRQGH